MLKPKISISPTKCTSLVSRKRPVELSPSRAVNGSERPSKSMRKDDDDDSRFTFDDVRTLLDSILAGDKKKLEYSINSGLTKINFSQVSVPGHSVESCQKLLDKLVDRTRRVRTTEEVLRDIRDNLNRRIYTDVIQRFALSKEPPKKPASGLMARSTPFSSKRIQAMSSPTHSIL